jgi:hypothetical protein
VEINARKSYTTGSYGSQRWTNTLDGRVAKQTQSYLLIPDLSLPNRDSDRFRSHRIDLVVHGHYSRRSGDETPFLYASLTRTVVVLLDAVSRGMPAPHHLLPAGS